MACLFVVAGGKASKTDSTPSNITTPLQSAVVSSSPALPQPVVGQKGEFTLLLL
jgi:hypothetical protein